MAVNTNGPSESADRALDALVDAADHIRDCARCRRIFRVAHDVVVAGENRHREFRPWGLTNRLLPELRRCGAWPKAI
jgi:hypothetical protein